VLTARTAIDRRPEIWIVSEARIATDGPGSGSADRVGTGVGVGLGAGVAVGDGDGLPDGEGEGEALGVGSGLVLGLGLGGGFALGLGVGTELGVGTALGAGEGVGSTDADGAGEGFGLGLGVAATAGGCGAGTPAAARAAWPDSALASIAAATTTERATDEEGPIALPLIGTHSDCGRREYARVPTYYMVRRCARRRRPSAAGRRFPLVVPDCLSTTVSYSASCVRRPSQCRARSMALA